MVQLSPEVIRMFMRNKRLSSLPILEQFRIKNMLEYWTPKDRAEWNAFMVKMVKKKTCVTYLSDQALLNVIQAARRTIWKQFSKQPEVIDPDLPACYYWNETECAEWIAESGFPEMKEAFLINHITGNKLIALDASAISKMGVRYFDTIKGITAKIREVLNIPMPNMMRALMRIPPMEAYLHRRIYKGRTYDLLTFEKFCETEGFPYDFLTRTDTNARIPPTCRLMLHLFPELISSDSESSSDSNSLAEVPTVELVTRHALMRNRIVQNIIDDLVDMVFDPELRLRFDGLVKDALRNFLEIGWRELGYDEEVYGKERIQFAVDVSKGLITEMMRTAQVLRDIQTTRKHIQKEISAETYEHMKTATEVLLEAVLPIAALLASGELELESIFRQAPRFQYYVEDIVKEAEDFTNKVIPKTENIIDEILKEAKLKIVATLFPEIPIDTIRSANEIMESLLDDLIQEGLADHDKPPEVIEDLDPIELEIDEDIQSMMGSLTAIPVGSRKSKVRPQPKPPTFTREEKFDPQSGMPILDRLTEEEIDNMLQSGKIETKDGRKISNNELLNRAMSEKKRRQSLRSSKSKATKYSPEEKLDEGGIPIVRRLSDKELEDIVNTGKMETADGKKLSITPEVANEAKAEIERRQKTAKPISRIGLQQVHAVKYPGKYTAEGGFQEFTRHDKFDDYGFPILERLTVDELEEILASGNIETKEGKRLSAETELLLQARQEAKRRNSAIEQAIQQRNPGKYTAEKGFHEFNREEKYDTSGMPILERLNADELTAILTSEKIETKDGKKVSINPQLLALAKEENNRRRSLSPLSSKRQNPGKYTKDGVFKEYSRDEKFDEQGKPIVDRLTTDELDDILNTGKIDGRNGQRVSLDAEQLSKVRAEKNQRRQSLLLSKSLNILQEVHMLKNPGKATSEGTFEPFSEMEKFDEAGLPILDRLTEEQLESLIFTRNVPTLDGAEAEGIEEIIEKAKQEIQRRRESINAVQKQIQEETFQRNYPGEYDSHGVFREFNQKEKFDPTTAQPVLERLNHKELEQVINTGMINNKDGPIKIPDDIRALAQIERRKRERRELLAQLQKDSYKRKYPGKMDLNGQFTEYSLHEKLDGAGYPIMQRLNIHELQQLLDLRMFYGTPINVDVVLRRAKMELERRKTEEMQDKMKLQINRKNYPGKVVDGEFEEYTFSEKFDRSNGFPIFERLNTEELEEIIKSGEVPTIDGIHITNEKLLEAARNEKQKRDSLLAHFQAEEKKFRRKLLSDASNYSSSEKYDSTGQPIFERFTDEDLEELNNSSTSNDEQVRTIQEQERRREEKKLASKTEESDTIQQYRKQFPRGKARSKSEGSIPAPAKLKLQDIVSKDKLTPEQRRLETLEAIKDLVSKKHEQQLDEVKAMPKTVTSNANLALFNGFIIDDFANVIGTADPFDGKIKDKTGKVLGIVTSQGMVFTHDGVALGRLGADVEQIGVGKFRALPKEIDSPEGSLEDISVKQDAGKTTKPIAHWNTAQAEIKGGVLMKKGNDWVREMEPTKNDLARKTEMALQIQQVEGYSPEQIIILEDEPIKAPSKGEDKPKKASTTKPPKDGAKAQEQTPDVSNDVKRLAAKEHERSEARAKSVRAKTLSAAQREVGGSKGVGGTIKGEETFLPHVDKKDLIAVPVPVSGKWGVQTPPSNEEQPHVFKPPPPLSTSRRPTVPGTQEADRQEKSNSQDMMLKVKTGEAKKLVAADGTVVGEIRKDGKIVNVEGVSVGRVEADGTIVKEDGSAMPDKGLKIIRPNGVVVGHVSDKGKLSPDREKERLLIGRIWGDGRIVTMDNALVGIVTKDGRIVGPGGKAIGLFTPGWELLGTDGVPFAYVSSDGKVYRYDVIPQKRFTPTKTAKKESFTVVEPEKSEAVIIFHKKRSLDFAFELPPVKEDPQDFTVAEKKYSFEEIFPDSKMTDDLEALARKKAEKERMKRDEEMLKQYDLDESHKTAAVKSETGSRKDGDVGVGTQTSSGDTAIKNSYEKLARVNSDTDHRVAKTSQEYLKQKQLHRKQLIENWANEVSDLMETKPDYFTIDPKLSSEERSRIARMAADTILDDIFKLALTHLLLQAEAGENTQRILAALAAIQTTGEGQALWQSHAQEDKRKSKMILKNMISFLPNPGEEHLVSSSDEETHGTKIHAPATAEAGVNTDAERAKERHHSHHRHHHRRRKKSNVMDISVGQDDDEAYERKRTRSRSKKTLSLRHDSKPLLPIKGQFSRIINPDEIEQFNQVFDNTGGRFAANILQQNQGQRKETLPRDRAAQLQRIPHPGVVDRGGKTVSAREDVAEQIHHGKQILAHKELPIQPQNPPQQRRSTK